MIQQKRDGVHEVLHVDLINLELAEQKIGGGEGWTVVAEPVPQLDDMAHLHPVDEDIDLPTVHAIKVEQALVPVEGVESLVALVAERLEQFLHASSLLQGANELKYPIA